MHRGLERATTPLERDDLLAAFLRRLINRCTQPARDERPAGRERVAVRRAIDYLHAHYARPVALADLSRAAALSPFHLHRVFRRAVGLPPHAYLVGVRVNRARNLLGRGIAPAEVAVATGFSDQSHLTRHFHRQVGVTPARFRAVAAPARRSDA
jgi:AraC-like DNA-binding protein